MVANIIECCAAAAADIVFSLAGQINLITCVHAVRNDDDDDYVIGGVSLCDAPQYYDVITVKGLPLQLAVVNL